MGRDQVRLLRVGIGTASVLLVVALGALMASASTGSAPKASGVVTITYADKGKTVDVNVGQTVRLVLNSTYWSTNASSDQAVLADHGSATVVPRLAGCVPGQGCGTVTSHFRALASGTVSISASRMSCGEALRCTNGNGSFLVTVVVR